MTATSAPGNRTEELRAPRLGSRFDEAGTLGQLIDRLRPDEGWWSLPLVLMLAFLMAWSIADARWIMADDDLTSFLMTIAVGAALWGYLAARLDISPLLGHALGAVIGAFVVIEVVGSVLPGATPGLAGWFQATAHSVTEAYLDLTWRHRVTTLQYGHFCLVLGIVVWGTAQAASYTIFGHHRAVNGVLLMAVVMIANMALTLRDQFVALVLFSAGALALLLEAHAADERSSWLRHRIWRGGSFEAPHQRGGMLFACAAICASMLLTSVASSAPLADAWPGLSNGFRDVATWVSRYLPQNGGGSRVPPGADFGDSSPIGPSFNVQPTEVFTVRVPDAAISYHWRVVAYDEFQGDGWSFGPGVHDEQVQAGSPLGFGTLNRAGEDSPGRTELSFTVHVTDTSLRHLVVMNEPSALNVTTGRTLTGDSSSNSSVVWYSSEARDYTVVAYVPDIDPRRTGLTEWMLRHDSTAFPPGVKTRYTQGADLVGLDGQDLLEEIRNWAQAHGNSFGTEYDVAKAIQDYLKDKNNFTYKTDIRADMVRCTGLSWVDCFAFIREGFCQQYATTMTMLMRMEGYPARYVLGYLPGELDQHTMIQRVTKQQQHAWVEVYFPTYGWIPFDPTGGSVGVPTEPAKGSQVVPTPKPSPSGSGPIETDPGIKPTGNPGGNGGTGATSGGDPLGMLPIVGVTGGVLALAFFALMRRRPRKLEGAEAVYGSIVRLATRLGYRPKPTQTVYEYTGMLAEVVPNARDSLGVVATAAVEVTYGRRRLGPDRLASLAAAQQRVRQALLRLALKLKPFGRDRGRKQAGRKR